MPSSFPLTMTAIPNPEENAPTPPHGPDWTIPPLHLKVLDLAHPGALRFFSSLPSPHAALSDACATVLKALYPPTLALLPSSPSPPLPAAPPAIRSITLILRAFSGVAHTNGSLLDNAHKEVHLSTSYLADLQGDAVRIRREIEGVLVHELVHAFQFDGEGTCDGGVIEGVADWVRIGARLGAPHWREGQGKDWKAGYATTGAFLFLRGRQERNGEMEADFIVASCLVPVRTAYFLVWLSHHLQIPLLVPRLNLALRSHKYKDGKLLTKLLGGKEPEDLWQVYKKELEEGEGKEGSAPPPPSPVPTHGSYIVARLDVGPY